MSISGPIYRFTLGCALFSLLAVPAQAHVGLVVGEPFGSFGTMMPAGHAGIYLDHVCASSPTHLRLCGPDESGVVLSRYHDLRARQLDWIAVPALTFFYGIDETGPDASPLPSVMSASLETELRESYREAHLRAVAPDRIDKHGIVRRPAYGDWDEAIGAGFDRRLFIYESDTTPAQDLMLIDYLNTQPDTRRYRLFHANCADFAADLLNVIYPGVFHRNDVADFHMMSPKQLSRLMEAYGKTHTEINLALYEVPQLPGSLRRSRPIRGAAETLLKTRRYLATLLVIQPEAVLTSWIIYETKGKWTPALDATVLAPGAMPPETLTAARPFPPLPESSPTESVSAQSSRGCTPAPRTSPR